METSQAVLRMVARTADGSKESMGYVNDCMVSQTTQKMTEDEGSALVEASKLQDGGG